MFCDWHMSCRSRALWLVGVRIRTIDRQRSCGKHLAMTCKAMYAAEGRDVTLTLTAISRAGLGEIKQEEK
jgi:hypothetical protein